MANRQLDSVLQYIRRIGRGTDAEGLTNRELLRRFGSGQDEDAFAALARRHGPLVLGVCGRSLRHQQDAEDAFQATFWSRSGKMS